MKVALVHDYLNEYGGAERVLEALTEIWPEAPIYTAFYRKGSAAHERFKDKKIISSWAHLIPGFASKLHSPLRFLAPSIWESFDFSGFDVVISSSSWYITKGIRVPSDCLHVSYIHTPPRFLYGYATSVSYQKYWPVKLYALLVNKGLRQFDFESAQRVDVLVANSKEVQSRIRKFWRRESTVVYPPVAIQVTRNKKQESYDLSLVTSSYFLTGGRLVGPKHFDLAIQAANRLGKRLKIFGIGPEAARLQTMAGSTVEFLGNVDEKELAGLYEGAIAFLALANDEDFGITPVESMMSGTPVLAYHGAGYMETVTAATGVFVEKLTAEAVMEGMIHIQETSFKKQEIMKYAQKFSKERFKKEMIDLVESERLKKRGGAR